MTEIAAPSAVRRAHVRKIVAQGRVIGVIVTHKDRPVKKYEVVVHRQVRWAMTLAAAEKVARRMAA